MTVEEAERLRETLEAVRLGHIVVDHTDDGTPMLLDLRTDPATPVRALTQTSAVQPSPTKGKAAPR